MNLRGDLSNFRAELRPVQTVCILVGELHRSLLGLVCRLLRVWDRQDALYVFGGYGGSGDALGM